MTYYIKKIGYSKRPEGFVISDIEKQDCLFWEEKSKLFFGTNSVPRDLTIGDILTE